MPTVELPPPIEGYFASKTSSDSEETLAWFTEDATVWDNGEDLVLRGLAEIRRWMTGTVADYKLSSEVVSASQGDGGYRVGVVLSGNFPGSPYRFDYRFVLSNGKISELAIDPIGPV